jgi:effector-binding domain-containing protein
MIEEPKVVHTEAQAAAVIHVTVPKNKIREVMGPGLKELRETLAAQGIEPTGPWFTHHLTLDPSQWDFEIGLPISAPVKPQGRVRAGELPALDVARTVYHGGYEGLGAAWGELMGWIEQQGHVAAPSLWEVYLDENPCRTELTRPLVKR